MNMEVIDRSAEIVSKLSQELEELEAKKKELELFKIKLQTELPTMKTNHEKIAKLAPMQLNSFSQEDVKSSEKVLKEAINQYKKADKEIKEIERSIAILHEKIGRDI